jgi:hypothetical protein
VTDFGAERAFRRAALRPRKASAGDASIATRARQASTIIVRFTAFPLEIRNIAAKQIGAPTLSPVAALAISIPTA